MTRTYRLDAWNLLQVTTLNVFYWKDLIELYEKRCRRAQYCTCTIGLLAGVVMAIADTDWVTTGITAGSTFLVAVIGGPLVKPWATGAKKNVHVAWSELHSETQRLWRHGEELGWDDREIVAWTAQLLEREKQYQAHEYHKRNTSVSSKCEEQSRSQLKSEYLREEH